MKRKETPYFANKTEEKGDILIKKSKERPHFDQKRKEAIF